MTSVTLLGPQRRRPFVKDVLDAEGVDGPLAVITGGWEEREGELDQLAQHVLRETVNLQLFRRHEQALKRDKPLADAITDRNDRLRVAQTLYRRRLGPALQTVRSLQQIKLPRMELLPAERAHALRAVADLDAHYLNQIRGIHGAFQDLWAPVERKAVAETRAKVAEELAGCAAVLIAGGHVGALIDQLTLFDLGPLLERKPIVAWSAGAMVLTERIVLFHDHPPQGKGDPEVYDDGLGLAPRVVALPHAGTRLKLDDRPRVGAFAERFDPATCVALDEGCGIRWDGRGWSALGPTRRFTSKGKLVGMVAP